VAEQYIKDGWDKPTVRVMALNEGRWGNAIWVRFAQTTSAKTLLTLDSTSARRGAGKFGRGSSVVRWSGSTTARIGLRVITRWTIGPSAERGDADRSQVSRRWANLLELVEFEVFASLKDRREAFRGLQLSPLSRRYVGGDQRAVAAHPD